MSSPCHTLSPHKCCLAKTKAPEEHMEEDWCLVFEGELDPVSSNDKKTAEKQDEAEKRAWEEAECLVHEEAVRRAEEECKAQEEVARVKEEAKRIDREAAEREEAVKRAAEAVEERADAK
ncbi:hypothetical protein ID866_12598 [Astraeus odoratus]|nr:hypothetical protein ID866_12598 [Astraeus odoratus]